MKIFKPLLATASFLLALQATPLQAEQVQIYDHPPSAEEMGRVLFGEESGASSGIKMRSISFGKKASPAPKSKAVAHESAGNSNASAELTSIGLPIKFAYNSDDILEESKPFLEEVGKMLTLDQYANKRIVIEGHTDSAGSDSYNKILSQRRADAVKHYLSKNFEIATTRLQSRGLGESKPLPGYSPEDEANRRVQFYSAG
ncbi:MAG: OmpA family protein [Methylococcaceae bacterium]|nr:OmpA family protein [Methylococcaceae bacterium]